MEQNLYFLLSAATKVKEKLPVTKIHFLSSPCGLSGSNVTFDGDQAGEEVERVSGSLPSAHGRAGVSSLTGRGSMRSREYADALLNACQAKRHVFYSPIRLPSFQHSHGKRGQDGGGGRQQTIIRLCKGLHSSSELEL